MTFRTKAAGLVAAIVVVLGLVACGTVRASYRTDKALQRSGFTGANVSTHHENGLTTVIVRYRASASSRAELLNAAGIVWRNFDLRFDAVEVQSTNSDVAFNRSDLQERFGPRPAGFDKRSVGNDLVRTGRTAAIVGAVVGGFFLILVVVAVVLIVHFVRKRKRNAPAAGPGVPQYGWGPPPSSGS